MFDSLSGGEQSGIENLWIGDFVGNFLCFVDDFVDGWVGYIFGIMVMYVEDLFDYLDLLLGFVKMGLECLF